MQLFKLLLLTLVITSSCGSGKNKKTDNKELFGAWKDNQYVNTFVNCEINFDSDWKIKKNSFQTRFGGTLFDANYLLSNESEYPINIEASVEKSNPFKKPSITEKIKESMDAYYFLFDREDVVRLDATKELIGGEEYILNEIHLVDQVDTSYIQEYYRFKDGYYITMTCTSNQREDQKTLLAFLNSIDKLK